MRALPIKAQLLPVRVCKMCLVRVVKAACGGSCGCGPGRVPYGAVPEQSGAA